MATIDYKKYEYMTERQLLNALINAEKKEAKLRAEFQEKIENYENLINFLKVEINKKLDNELEISKSKKEEPRKYAQMKEQERKEQAKPKTEHKQELLDKLETLNQELEDKNKRIAELEGQLKRERKVNSDEFVDKKELKKKNKKSKQKAK